MEFLGLVTVLKPPLVVPTLREAQPAGNTSDLDVNQPLLSESASGDSVPDVPPP